MVMNSGVEAGNDVKRVPISCPHDCGGQCLMWARVENGVIVRIESDETDQPPGRACARGLSSRRRTYAPDRLKYPMRRVGERGEAKFERISWGDALDEIAAKMKRVKEEHGPGAFVNLQYSGEPLGGFQGVAVGRLLNMFGGNLQHWGGASLEGSHWSAMATYGARWMGVKPPCDPLSARLIILWARNVATTRGGNDPENENNPAFLFRAKESGARIVCVDPRYTETAAIYADEWIPIIPGTDAAMLIAMAHVLVRDGLEDRQFLSERTVGFERYRDYVMGVEDGVAKTPSWAEAITGVPADVIERLAREYAAVKPASLVAGWGAGRTPFGEQYFRAASALSAMTGNTDIDMIRAAIRRMEKRHGGFTTQMYAKGKNSFDYDPEAPPGVTDSLDPAIKSRRRVLQGHLYDAMLKGKAGGYPSDIKMVWVNCANTLNQLPNTNKGVKAFRQLEFILASEQFMTSTAKFADILLPVTTHLERSNIFRGGDYLFYSAKAIEPLYGAKSDFQICAELAPRLGIDNYSDPTKTEEELVYEHLSPLVKEIIGDFELFKRRGFLRMPVPRDDESRAELPTPSRRIEIYSENIAALNDQRMPPIPKYLEGWEGRNDPLAKKYPLQLLTTHFRLRVHSGFDNIPWLKQAEPQTVTINTMDAEARGIRNGDQVKVFNDRGTVVIPATVTERITPGAVNISEGAWYRPDTEGVDWGGCANVLTTGEHSPGGAWCTHNSLVQIEKWSPA